MLRRAWGPQRPRPSRLLPAPSLLARHCLLGIVALLALQYPGGVEKTHHAIRRLRALRHPGLGLFQIEFQPLGFFLRQQRIEMAETFDETAVARRAAVGDDDVIERPLLGAGARHTNNERHFGPSFCHSGPSVARSPSISADAGGQGSPLAAPGMTCGCADSPGRPGNPPGSFGIAPGRPGKFGRPGIFGGKPGSAGHSGGSPPGILLASFAICCRARHAAAQSQHAGEAGHRAALGAAHRLHHVGHGAMHLEQPVDVLDLGAGAGGDALLAAGFEDVGIAPLLRRHRVDDRELALEHACRRDCARRAGS